MKTLITTIALLLPTTLFAHVDTSDALKIHKVSSVAGFTSIVVDTSHLKPDTGLECVALDNGVPVATGYGYSTRIATTVIIVAPDESPTEAICYAE